MKVRESRVLAALRFELMDERFHDVKDAHETTYDWIFEGSPLALDTDEDGNGLGPASVASRPANITCQSLQPYNSENGGGSFFFQHMAQIWPGDIPHFRKTGSRQVDIDEVPLSPPEDSATIGMLGRPEESGFCKVLFLETRHRAPEELGRTNSWPALLFALELAGPHSHRSTSAVGGIASPRGRLPRSRSGSQCFRQGHIFVRVLSWPQVLLHDRWPR